MINLHWLPTLEKSALDNLLQRVSSSNLHLLAYVAERDKEFVQVIQAACNERGITLAGAIFPELIADDQLGAKGALIIAVTDSPAPLLLSNVVTASAVAETAKRLTDYVEDNLSADQEAALFCIFDALVPNIATHLDAWYRMLADRVTYFGVNAGSETFQPMACLFDNHQQIGDGVLIQLLPNHPGACLNHDYSMLTTHFTATSAEGNRIVQIDWKPPLEVYRDLMRTGYGVEISKDNFYQYAVHYPFGIVRADGEVLVRIPVALAEDGSIYCVGEIPPNSMLTVLDAGASFGLTAGRMAIDLKNQGTPVADEDLLFFYCAGRRMHLGDKMLQELVAVQRATDARHLYGALSLGEIGGAHSGGYPLFHNATLVAVPCR